MKAAQDATLRYFWTGAARNREPLYGEPTLDKTVKSTDIWAAWYHSTHVPIPADKAQLTFYEEEEEERAEEQRGEQRRIEGEERKKGPMPGLQWADIH